jgi:hypothetical protein
LLEQEIEADIFLKLRRDWNEAQPQYAREQAYKQGFTETEH